MVLRGRGRPRDDAAREHDIADRRGTSRAPSRSACPCRRRSGRRRARGGPARSGRGRIGAEQRARASSCHALPARARRCAPPERRSPRCDADEVGALADRDLAAIVRPTASAGVLVTVRIAAGRSMLGAAVGSRKRRHQQARRHIVGRQDVEHARRCASSAVATLPECEPPRTRLGAPISTLDRRPRAGPRRPPAWSGTRRSRRRRAIDSATCSSVVSSWLASGVPCALRQRDQLAPVARGIRRVIAAAAWRTARRARRRSGRRSCRDNRCAASPRRGTGAGRACGPSARSAARPSRPIIAARVLDHARHRDLAAQMQEVLGAQQIRRRARRAIASASSSCWPSTSSTPSSRQTRSESSTVVMPQVASCPS